MNAILRDRITAFILLAVAIAWSVTVYKTIPAASIEGQIGPRDFPFFLGLVLIFISALILFGTFISSPSNAEPRDNQEMPAASRVHRARFAIGVFGLIILYGFLMEKIGFVIATPALIIGTLAGLLRLRSPVLIIGLAIGITAACWLIFNKLLGIYLPPGSWITII
jgi:hypothetical protein